jgi:hypothetical protein
LQNPATSGDGCGLRWIEVCTASFRNAPLTKYAGSKAMGYLLFL